MMKGAEHAKSEPPVDAPADQVEQPALSPRRRRWFAIIALSLPFLLLLAAEGICRLTGRGGYPPVVKYVGDDHDQHWYTTYRPGVDSFFYTNRSRSGGMRESHFVTPKPKNTVRILFLGGSAMQGWPQPRPLANSGFLEMMLTDVWDDGRVPEVINMGATAMASFPAVHFLDAMLDHDLDLVVIMTGNNEFYGAYGVASLHTAGTSPFGMRAMRTLRGLGLSQWLRDVFQPEQPPTEQSRKTLMEIVAVNQQVGPDDPLRSASERTLRANITEMVKACTSRRIPVVVCTLPTNERGLAPIGEDVPPPLSEGDIAKFDALLAKAKDATDPAEAESSARSAIGMYAKNAESHYLLGRSLATEGKYDDALAEYTKARDLDTMPWRALSSANATARSMADLGATVCDIESAFRAASPEGAIGWEFLDDHVHMSVQGQVLFARTLARTMTKLAGPLHVDAERLDALPDWQTYAERAGENIYTQYVAAQRMSSLFDVDFLTRSNPEATQRWRDRCEELVAQMSDLDREALQQWKDPGLHVSNTRPLTFVVGYYHMLAGDYAGALPLLEFAQASLRDVSVWRLQLGWYIVKCRRALHSTPTEEDRKACQEAIRIGSLLARLVGFPTPEGAVYLGLVYHAVGKYDAAIFYLDPAITYVQGTEGAEAVYALADSLIKTGDEPRARKLLNLAVKDPAFAPVAQELLNRLDGSPQTGDGLP